MKAVASHRIRRMRSEDAEAVWAVSRAVPEAAQWSREDYSRAVEGGLNVWVAEKESRIAAFLVTRRAADEMEILNLAVAPEARRRGIARELLEANAADAGASGIRKVFLEVRASNSGAISFYQRVGFSAVGSRKGYYSDPPDDAILMSVALR
jgi:ribosomal-protein-alanine N-acetyltransferase